MALTSRDRDSITIFSFADPHVVSDLTHDIRELIDLGYSEAIIRLDGVEGIFPNCAVPVTALLQKVQQQGVAIRPVGDWEYVQRLQLLEPIPIREADNAVILHKVWSFDPDDNTSSFLTNLKTELSERLRFGPDVLWGLEWALNEVMDNVLLHSEARIGYLMAQVHPGSERPRVVICVSDQGIGLKKSLEVAYPKIRNDRDAITMALRPGVTRDKKLGQGNGLWGLGRIIAATKGRLAITSGAEQLTLDPSYVQEHGTAESHKVQFFGYENPGTTVDFQMITDRTINIRELLELPSATNLRFEQSVDDRERHRISIHEGPGTGTRIAGERLRMRAMNSLNEGAAGIILDFSGVAVVTSSFADELVGKLMFELGFLGFNQRVQLAGVDPLVELVIQRAVTQRMNTLLNGNS